MDNNLSWLLVIIPKEIDLTERESLVIYESYYSEWYIEEEEAEASRRPAAETFYFYILLINLERSVHCGISRISAIWAKVTTTWPLVGELCYYSINFKNFNTFLLHWFHTSEIPLC